jgi:hypothetical protein
LHALPLGLAGLALGIFIWLAWHFGCRKENFTVGQQSYIPIPVPTRTGRSEQKSADLRVSVYAGHVLVEPLTMVGVIFLEADTASGVLVLDHDDYPLLARNATEAGLVIENVGAPKVPAYLCDRDVQHSVIQTKDIVELERMLKLPPKGQQ